MWRQRGGRVAQRQREYNRPQILVAIRNKFLPALGDIQLQSEVKISQAVKTIMDAKEQFKLAVGMGVLFNNTAD